MLNLTLNFVLLSNAIFQCLSESTGNVKIQSRLSMASENRHPFKESQGVVFVATDCLLRIFLFIFVLTNMNTKYLTK